MKFNEKFKEISCDGYFMQMVLSHMDGYAYEFRAFDGWKDVVVKHFGKRYFSDVWIPTEEPVNGQMYLLLVDDSDAVIVDVMYAEEEIRKGIRQTVHNMLWAEGI